MSCDASKIDARECDCDFADTCDTFGVRECVNEECDCCIGLVGGGSVDCAGCVDCDADETDEAECLSD